MKKLESDQCLIHLYINEREDCSLQLQVELLDAQRLWKDGLVQGGEAGHVHYYPSHPLIEERIRLVLHVPSFST